MSAKAPRNDVSLAVAVVVAAVIVAVAISFTYHPGTSTTVTVISEFNNPTSTTSSTTQAVAYPANVTLQYGKIPPLFTVGQYLFNVTSCGPCKTVSGGTVSSNPADSLFFNATYQGQSQTMAFGWAPAQNPSGSPPDPSSASAFNGAVNVRWFKDAAGLFVNISAET